MADLISREAAKEEILSWAVRITSPNNLSTADTMYVLDMLPAVDAVEVVRCRDCKHGIKDDFDNLWQCIRTAEYDEETDMYFGFSSFHVENFYCADGERREENG